MELAKYLFPGGKVELQDVGKQKNDDELADIKRYYASRISDLLPEDLIEIYMPMESEKYILLQTDIEYDAYFYTGKDILQAYVRVVGRYKKKNLILASLEMTSNLRKYQRREFYRYTCSLYLRVRPLEQIEEVRFLKKERCFLPEALSSKGTIVDISGGGLRFVSEEKFEKGQFVYCSYSLDIGGRIKEYHLISKVLSYKNVENLKELYEYRVQFYNITKLEREEIIRFIFEEERKNRRKEKWGEE